MSTSQAGLSRCYRRASMPMTLSRCFLQMAVHAGSACSEATPLPRHIAVFQKSAPGGGGGPAPWQQPVAQADSISGGTVGSPTTISAATLTGNDLFDTRGSISITSVGNAVGCTVSLNSAAQTVSVTPNQTSPVNFTYTITDTQSFT